MYITIYRREGIACACTVESLIAQLGKGVLYCRSLALVKCMIDPGVRVLSTKDPMGMCRQHG